MADVVAEVMHIMSKDSPFGELEQIVQIDGELYKMTAKYHPAVINGEVTKSNLFGMKLERI